MTGHQETEFLQGQIDGLAVRMQQLENRLEVLAAMVETPPPYDYAESLRNLSNRMVAAEQRQDNDYIASGKAFRQIEALELRQNLVESPVMLRLADAAERQAVTMATLAEWAVSEWSTK